MLLESRAGPLPPDPEISLNSADLSEASLFSLLTSQPGDYSLEKKKNPYYISLDFAKSHLLCPPDTVSPALSFGDVSMTGLQGWGGGHGHRRGCHFL